MLSIQIKKHLDHWDMIGMYVPKGNADDNGNILNYDWVDGGDSCHFVGILSYLYFMYPSVRHREVYAGRIMFLTLVQHYNILESQSFFGGLKRHPDRKYWYSEDNRMSRDQLTPMLCALAAASHKHALWRQFKAHLKRGLLFTTNTRRNGATANNHGQRYGSKLQKTRNYNWKLPDITIFDIWSIYIRGFNWWFLYPILLLGDLQNLVGAFFILKNKEDVDVANFFLKHSLSRKKLPTFISKITQKFLLTRLNLASRVAFNYARPGMPQFLGNILREAVQQEVINARMGR